MLSALKALIREYLKRRSKYLVYLPSGEPTGLSPAYDLPMLVKAEAPVVFDVGANVGQSIEDFRQLFPKASIYSFEPSPESFEKLQARDWGDHTRLFNFALGEREEKRTLLQFDQSVFNSFLSVDESVHNPFRTLKASAQHHATIRTLDHVVSEFGIEKIDLLKIDTQGWDMNVLLGAEISLKSGLVDVIFVELNFCPIYEGQPSPAKIMDHLANRGYRLVDFYDIFRNGPHLSWCMGIFSR